MFIRNLKVSGLLSFGPQGIDLPMENLNVLIGPNGSGKSNLLEVLALLRASPNNLPEPVKEMGGVRAWLWSGTWADVDRLRFTPREVAPRPPYRSRTAVIDAVIDSQPLARIRHFLEFCEHGGRFEVLDEHIGLETPAVSPTGSDFVYRYREGDPVLNDSSGESRALARENLKPEESILSQVRDPERYPELHWLQENYEQISLHRNWSFGPAAPLRREQSTHARADTLSDGGENLALVLSKIRSRVKNELLESLRKLFDGIDDFGISVEGGTALLFLEEAGGRVIPATRLSDGTLRYLCLLAILHHPEPPPLIAIEEPELGLHPDILPHIAELLVRASERTQLVVTTHSRQLVDALSDHPSSVVVCSKENGESRFERLDADALSAWLDRYSLGDLWSKGELGGNRW